jgi:hypothetical protein
LAVGSGGLPVEPAAGLFLNQDELTPARFLEEHDQRLASHAYFSKVLMLRGAPSQAPIALYLQRPQVETPNWQAELTGAHLPWFEALEREFSRTLAIPLGLKRRADIPLNVVCVLQTQGDYVNYAGALQNTMWVRPWGAFERRSRWTVAFHSGGKSPLVERRRGILHEFAEALLHAHLGAGVGELRSPWVVTGLGAYFTSSIGAVPTTLASRTPSARALAEVASTVADDSARQVYLAPISELVRASEAQQLVQNAAARAQALNGKVNTERMLQRLGAQCELWMHFLLDAGGQQRRADTHEYLGLVLSGRAVDGAFEKAFAPETPEQLQREFFRWALSEHAKLDPKAAVDLALVETLFRPTPPAGASAKPGAAGPKPAPVATAPAAAAQPSALASVYQRLAPAPDDHLAAHGRVLQRIVHGELALARTELDALLERAKGADIERRLQRERERLAALTALRDAHFAALVTSGAKKSWSFGQRKFSARLVKYENETLHFEDNKLGFATLEAKHVPHSIWLKDVSKELASGEHGWARHYAALLEGSEGALKRLDKNDARCEDLRADFESWYPGVLRLGEAVKRLDEIVATGLIADSTDATAQFEALSALRRDFGALEFVKSRDVLLREAASLAAVQGFSLAALIDSLPGRCVAVGDGRIRWRLDFDSPEEERVFERRPELLSDYRKSAADPSVSDEASARVAAGHLRLDGSCSWKLPLAFAAPLRQRVRLRWPDEGRRGASRFLSVLGVRGESTYIASNECGDLIVTDRGNGVELKDWTSKEVLYGRYYDAETSVDATHVSTKLDGVDRARLESRGVGAGDVAFMVHSVLTAELDVYEIEGRVDEASAKRLWVKLRLAAAGW